MELNSCICKIWDCLIRINFFFELLFQSRFFNSNRYLGSYLIIRSMSSLYKFTFLSHLWFHIKPKLSHPSSIPCMPFYRNIPRIIFDIFRSLQLVSLLAPGTLKWKAASHLSLVFLSMSLPFILFSYD